jgi:hypothetical protein
MSHEFRSCNVNNDDIMDRNCLLLLRRSCDRTCVKQAHVEHGNSRIQDAGLSFQLATPSFRSIRTVPDEHCQASSSRPKRVDVPNLFIANIISAVICIVSLEEWAQRSLVRGSA